MGKKAVGDRGKKTDILMAASKSFLRNGYDGTSIREIMKEAGAEVGLFYYYFEGKDDVFNQALKFFYKDYSGEMRDIVEHAEEDPYRVLSKIFLALRKMVRSFEENYADILHPSVQGTLRSMILEEVESAVEVVLECLIKDGAKIGMEPKIAAMFMAYGVGGIVLHYGNDNEWVEGEVRKCINLIMGISDEEAEAMHTYYGTKDDAEELSALHEECRKEGLCGPLSVEDIGMRLHEKEILLIKKSGKVAGFVAFSKKEGAIIVNCIQKEFRGTILENVLEKTAYADIKEYERKRLKELESREEARKNASKKENKKEKKKGKKA